MKLILGSGSITRKKILEEANYTFEVMSADIDEKTIRSTDFSKLPLLIAQAKAKALLTEIREEAILITADQVIVCNRELREKPESKEQAEEYLRSYAHYPAQTITGIVVTNTKTGKQASDTHIAKIHFKKIPDSVIATVLKDGRFMNVAGGFKVEDPLLEEYIDHIEGSIDSIRGLPLGLVEKLITEVS